jgi:RNA polymerase sigma-70 factor (ECF subfamily)
MLEDLRRGDLEAFSSIFRLHYEPLSLFAVRYLRDLQAAENIVQDIFVRLWEARNSLNVHTNLKSYLYASVRNACLNYLKHASYSKSLDEAEVQSAGPAMQPDIQAESNELAAALEDAINGLPPKCRQVFCMAKYDDLSYQEIAEILAISVNTVKTQLRRALKSLSAALQHFQLLLLLLIGRGH